VSLIPIGISVAIATAENLLTPFFLTQSSIGGMVPDVTVEEKHVDELTITEHPVEQGAAIADHAYKRPVTCTITAGWSNSSPQALGDANYVQTIYQLLIALQASRQPFDIVTIKRLYRNMLISRLLTDTDRRSAHSMIVIAECREVIIVQTQVVTVPAASVQKNPQVNAPTLNTGAKALVPATSLNVSSIPEITVFHIPGNTGG